MSFFTDLFGTSTKTDSTTSAISLVTNTASLVSNPEEVDNILDSVREITSRLQPGEPIAIADKAILFDTYLQIEKYLMTKDPIRTFSKEELRQRIGQTLRTQLETHETKNYSKGV